MLVGFSRSLWFSERVSDLAWQIATYHAAQVSPTVLSHMIRTYDEYKIVLVEF